MRRAVLSSLAITAMMACGYGYEARTTTITGASMVTSGPEVGERELSRSLTATSEQVATEICRHEQRCGRGDDVSACVDATVPRARAELMRWSCEPAAIRARLEECLAGLDEQPCVVRPTAQGRELCPRPNAACTDRPARVTSPGPALAEIWR